MRTDAPEPTRPGERFRETQKLAGNRLFRVLMVAEPIFMGLTFLALGLTIARAAGGVLIVAWLGAGVILPAALSQLRMVTTVTGDELVVRWRPIHTARVRLAGVESATPVRYDPISEAGGWGIKRSKKYGLVLNVSGDRGVAIVAGERRLLVGTGRPDDLAEAVLEGAIDSTPAPSATAQS